VRANVVLLLRINGELFWFNIKNALLLFNTTRAHSPTPKHREPLSPWTEMWPTQPVECPW
jgi:hypothetical protein